MNEKDKTTRRRFFRAAGAVLSAPLAVAASGRTRRADAGSLNVRLRRLEDLNAIGELNRRYAGLLNADAKDELAKLFVDPDEAPRAGPIRGVSAEDFARQDAVELSADGETAVARIACTVRIETPIEPVSSLVEMARQQGGGVLRRTETGTFESVYVRREEGWKIHRMRYRSA